MDLKTAGEKGYLWIFNWQGGGYNNVIAKNRKEALVKIKKEFGKTTLKLDPKTLHAGTYEELRTLDRAYAWD